MPTPRRLIVRRASPGADAPSERGRRDGAQGQAAETQPAPVAVPAETVVSKASRRRTLGLAVAGTAIVAAGSITDTCIG